MALTKAKLIADGVIDVDNLAAGHSITTSNIGEGDKLFYTDARVGAYLTGNGYDTAANIIATITDSAPATLDTLNELAAALGDDPNYATTTATLIGTKITTDSDASLNSLTTVDLSVNNGVVLDGGISSIGSIGHKYSITTGSSNSLIIANNEPGGSILRFNNSAFSFDDTSYGIASISGQSIQCGDPNGGASMSAGGILFNNASGFSFITQNGYLVYDNGGSYPDNGGFVRLSSTESIFSTHATFGGPDTSQLKITQNPNNGNATIRHQATHTLPSFDISTDGNLNISGSKELVFSSFQEGFTFFVGSGKMVNMYSDLRVGGKIEAGQDIIAFYGSDKRLKDNIKQIPNAINKIQSIGGYSFNWNDKQDTYEVGSRDIGVVAQEIEEVLPELVITRDNGYKAVKYEKIVALLIEGIKEQQEQINELRNKLDGITN